MTGSPFAEDPAPPTEAGLEAPQKGMGVGAGVPPSTRVRTLSRQFSDKTQQSQIARSAACRNISSLALCPHCHFEGTGGAAGGGGGGGSDQKGKCSITSLLALRHPLDLRLAEVYVTSWPF